MKKNKILFLIPDGVGIRNYLYSDVIKHLKYNNTEIAFWSTLPKEAFTEVNILHNLQNLDYKKIELKPEGVFTRIFRESATYARLIYNANKVNNETILGNWQKEGRGFKQTQLYNLAEKIGSWASKKYSRILWLEKKSIQYWDKSIIESYKNDLKQLNPTSIFITHQRVASLMPICIAAQELGIEVISVIYSWDNMPKARLAIEANKYLVWSEYMKSEFNDYYPEIDLNNVFVTGTPQFEFYLNESFKTDRMTFAVQYNLDPEKKWICYSGDDTITSPYDQYYLEDLTKNIIDLKLQEQYHIIFRRCPADFSERFDTVLNNYKDLITSIDPEWYSSKEGWAANYPKFSDLALLVNIVNHCELVINLGSTMAHDFAMLNKPCAYIKYDKPGNPNWSSKKIYNFQHFRTIGNLNPVIWIDKATDLKKIFSNNNTLQSKDSKEWLNIIVNDVNNASKNIAKILLK